MTPGDVIGSLQAAWRRVNQEWGLLRLDFDGYANPTLLGSGTPSGSTFLAGNKTWVAAPSGTVADGDYGDIVVAGGVWTIESNAVTNAQLAAMPEATIKGRAVGTGTGDPIDLTATQATAILNVFSPTLQGLAPASGGGMTNFLRADGTWAVPGGGGGGGTPAGADTYVQFNDGGAFGGDVGLVFNKTTDTLSVGGQVLNALGSATAPSYSFTGDPNTGVYSAGANLLSFATNGVRAGGFDASGNFDAVGIVVAAAGNATTPGFSFAIDPDTGLRRSGTNAFSFVSGGADRVLISTTACRFNVVATFPDGLATAPSFSYVADTNTGIYRIGADDMGFATGGALRFEISNSGVSIANTGGTDHFLRQLTAGGPVTSTVLSWADIPDAATLPPGTVLGRGSATTGVAQNLTVGGPLTIGEFFLDFDETAALGNNARMAVGKNGGATVGTRRRINFIEGANVTLTVADDGANEEVDVTIAASGGGGGGTPGGSDTHVQFNDAGAFGGDAGLTFNKTTDALSVAGQVLGATGSAGAPSYSFTGDPNTGIYSSATDTLAFSVAGTIRVSLSTSALSCSLPFLATGGSAAAPTFSFSTDPDTGMYSGTANTLSFTTGGTRRGGFDASGNLEIANTGGIGHVLKQGSAGGDVSSAQVATADIANSAVTFAKIQNIATARILGRVTAGTGAIEELTGTQATTLLDSFAGSLKGLVPVSVGGTANFLRADGIWAAPPGGGGGGTPGGANTHVQFNDSGTFGGDAGLTFDKTADILAVGAEIVVPLITLGNTGLHLLDTDASHDLVFVPGSDLTLDRTLTIVTGDVNRILTFTGDASISGINTGDQTITLTGDVTGSGTASFPTTIANDAVTFAKFQNLNTDRILGRDAVGTGDPEELTVSGGIEFTGTGGIRTSAFTGDVTKTAGGTVLTLANDIVTFAKLQNINTDRLLGRDTAGIGDPEELTVSGGIEFTGIAGIRTSAFTGDVTKSAGGTVLTIAADAVTNAKLANVPAATLKGNNTGISDNPLDLTTTAVTAMLNLFTSTLRGLVPPSGGGAFNFLRADGAWAIPPGSGGGGTPGGADTQVQFNDAGAFGGDAGLTFNKTTDILTVGAEITVPLITLGNTGLHLLDTDASHDLVFIPGSNLTADRTLTIVTGDVNRTLTFTGDASISGTNTGDQTITLTGDVTGSGTGSFAATIANNTVTFAKMQDIATATILGRITAGTGDPEALTGAQATTLLDVFTSTTKGLAPLSGGGSLNFLRADGFWAVPPGGAASVPGGSNTHVQFNDSGIFGGDAGLVFNKTTDILTVGGEIVAPVITLNNTGLHLLDTNASHDLIIAPGSDLTADRTLTIVTGDINRTLTFTGNASISGTNTGDQTITLTGDVTGSGTGSFATTIATAAVTFAKFQNLNTDSLFGRDLAGAGVGTNITVTGGIEFTGSNSIQTSAFTGDVTKTAGGTALTIAGDAVTNAKLADMTALTIKGNNTGVAANPLDLTSAQVTAMLDIFTSTLQGLVPLSSGGTTNFLRADGMWAAPPGGGGGGVPGGSDTHVQFNDSGTFGGDAGLTFNKTTDALSVAGQVLGATGSAATPSYSFTGDPNTGMYSSTTDTIGFSTGGIIRVSISTSVLSTTLSVHTLGGTATAPSHSFSGDSDTGMHSGGLDILCFSTGGVERVNIDATSLDLIMPIRVNAGSAATPSHSFTGETDCGIYSGGLNLLDFATSGVRCGGFDAAGNFEIANTGGTGHVLKQGAAGGDVTSAQVATADIANSAITLAKIANIATARILGRVTALSGIVEELTGTQATTILDSFAGSLKGLVPVSVGGTANFLRADGAWAVPPGGGGGGTPGGSNTHVQFNDSGAFGGDAGLVYNKTTDVLTIAGELVVPVATLGNVGLHILDTDATHDLIVSPGSNLTADRTLSIVTGDINRTLTFTADASIGGTNTGDQTITLTGDVTGSGTGSFATTIAAGVVTLAKMANIATDRLIGRDTVGTGVPEALTVSGGIEFTGAGGIQTSAFTGDVTKVAGGTATTIAANAVTTVKILDANVTLAKIASIATARILGRVTAASGVIEELAGTQATTLLDVFAPALKGLVPPSGGGALNFLRADGLWAIPPGSGGGGTPGGLNTQVQFNDSGAFGGDAGLVFNKTTDILTVGAEIVVPTITLANAGLHILDTNATHDLIISAGSDLTLDRTLSIITGDINRTLTFTANASIGGTNTGDQTITLTGDVTGTGTGSFATTIAANSVTFAKMADIATDRLIGRDTALTGDPEAITVAGGIEFTGAGGIQTSAFTGDVTKSAGGTITTIAAAAVTLAKMANIATDRLIGRDTAGTGVPEAIAVGGGIEFTGLLGIQTSAFTGDVTKTAGGTALTIANDAVTNAKLRNSAALSVIGNATNLAADPADIVAGLDGQVLRLSSTTLAFGAVNLASANAVTGDLPYANLTPATAISKLLGRGAAAGAGDWQEITLGTNLTMSGTTLNATGGGGGTPGGSNTQLQYNNAGAFGGIVNLIFNGTQVQHSLEDRWFAGGADTQPWLKIMPGGSTKQITFSSGSAATDTNLKRGGVGLLMTDNQFTATDGVVMPAGGGTPTDGLFVNPVDGLIAIDTTNHKLWFRSGGTWRGPVG